MGSSMRWLLAWRGCRRAATMVCLAEEYAGWDVWKQASGWPHDSRPAQVALAHAGPPCVIPASHKPAPPRRLPQILVAQRHARRRWRAYSIWRAAAPRWGVEGAAPAGLMIGGQEAVAVKVQRVADEDALAQLGR